MSKSASNAAVIPQQRNTTATLVQTERGRGQRMTAVAPTINGSLVRRLRLAIAYIDWPNSPQNLARFAERAHISASYLSDIELGRRTRPSCNVIYNIAQTLGVSPLAIEAQQ